MFLTDGGPSQVNYDKPSAAIRWVFHNTGKEVAWLGLAAVFLVFLEIKDLDPTDDELNW